MTILINTILVEGSETLISLHAGEAIAEGGRVVRSLDSDLIEFKKL